MKTFKDFRNEIQEGMLDSVRARIGSIRGSIRDGVRNRIEDLKKRQNKKDTSEQGMGEIRDNKQNIIPTPPDRPV